MDVGLNLRMVHGPLSCHDYAIKEELECIETSSLQSDDSTPVEPNHALLSSGTEIVIKSEDSSHEECAESLASQTKTTRSSKEKDSQSPEETCIIQNKLPRKIGSHVSGNSDNSTICKRVTRQSTKSKEQRRSKKTKTSYTCTDCGKVCHHRSNLIIHQRTHSGDKPYTCTDCGKSFSQRANLTIHQRTHTGERPHICFECGASFTQSSTLINHKQTHNEGKPYTCSQCEKKYGMLVSLIRHQKTHSGTKPCTCSDCGKSFSRTSYLLIHKRIHKGEKPYLCCECGKSFSQKSHLAIHQRVHTGEKPYTCKQCGKGFSSRTHLSGHQRTHTGEKPFKCTDCGKSFKQSAHLRTHRRTHTGEAPYTCTVCGKSCTQKSNLITHQRIHTGEKPFTCECGKSFVQKSELVAHQGTHLRAKIAELNAAKVNPEIDGANKQVLSNVSNEEQAKENPAHFENKQTRNWDRKKKIDLMWSCVYVEIKSERNDLSSHQKNDLLEEMFRKRQPNMTELTRKNLIKHKNYIKNHKLFNSTRKEILRQEVLEYMKREEMVIQASKLDNTNTQRIDKHPPVENGAILLSASSLTGPLHIALTPSVPQTHETRHAGEPNSISDTGVLEKENTNEQNSIVLLPTSQATLQGDTGITCIIQPSQETEALFGTKSYLHIGSRGPENLEEQLVVYLGEGTYI